VKFIEVLTELHGRFHLLISVYFSGLPVSTTLGELGASAVIYGGMDEKGIAFEGVEKSCKIIY